MATLTVTVQSGSGTSTMALAFSAADAQRILTAYQGAVQPGGTQDQLVVWLGTQITKQIGRLVTQNESIPPAAPVFS